MPWKNGQGTTSEIEIAPKAASLDKGDFLWRISSATVQAPNTFSTFSGYDRILAVVKGDAIMLNDYELPAFVPHRFAGENKIDCKPLGGTVVDFGIIYKRGEVKADMMVHSFWNRHVINMGEATHFFYCAEGSILVDEKPFAVGDTLRVEGPGEIWFECAEPSFCIQIVVRT